MTASTQKRPPRDAYPWNEVASKWVDLVPDVCRRWPEVTYMEAMAVAGRRERLCNLLMRRYGVSFEHADDMLFAWQTRLASLDGDAGKARRPRR